MSRHYAHTVTVLRAPLVVDRYNNRKRDWDNPQSTTVAGVNMQPASATEDTDDRQVTASGWRLHTPRGMDIDLEATDRVAYDGMVLEVVGEVAVWRISGRIHHVEAQLKVVT